MDKKKKIKETQREGVEGVRSLTQEGRDGYIRGRRVLMKQGGERTVCKSDVSVSCALSDHQLDVSL